MSAHQTRATTDRPRATALRRLAVGTPLAAAILAVAALLRAPITAVPSVLDMIRTSLHLTPFETGATTSLPLVCFGVFAFAAPVLIARVGLERTVVALLIPLLVGTMLRSAGSTAAFFAGAVLVGCGIAVGNAVVPAFIRTRFPQRVASLMGWYSAMLQVSGAVGAAVSVPLAADAGWGWNAAVGLWAVPLALVLVWWLVIDRAGPHHDAASIAPPTGLRHIAARPLSWGITAYMGLQSMAFYTLLTWLPSQLADRGLTPSVAGLLLGAFSLLGLPGSFVAPRYAVSRHAAAVVVSTMGVQAAALLLLGAGPVAAVVAVIVLGLTQGASLSIALTYIAAQPDHHDVGAVSALSQGVGYFVAAAGPVALGLIVGAEHHWWAANLTLAALSLTILAVGVVVGPRLHRRGVTAARGA